ncbi:hypothetical protein [Pseudonocardia phyllosphaerae]|uniref:hypothetical protein n=1 Tax=Pseudonocardia phyllosphaerae TaxID=3390502 RepID=UPI003977FEDD
MTRPDIGAGPGTDPGIDTAPGRVSARPARRVPLALVVAPVAAVAVLLTAVLTVRDPAGGPLLAAGAVAGLVAALGAALLLYRRPWLAPWGVILLFSTTAELRVRLGGPVGAAKDLLVALLVVVLAAQLLGDGRALARLRTHAFPLGALGLLVALYLLDPAGQWGLSWVFGSRMLLEGLLLLMIGLLCAQPERTTAHLVRALTVVLPVQAALAWAQQAAGADALMHSWGYQWGAQVRVTSDGGLRTTGAFEDPFQLAALAVLGTAVALFLASRTQAVILLVSAAAVLAATSVRTAALQVAIAALVWMVRRGWARQAAVLAVPAVAAVLYLLATTTTALYPGAPETPLLFGLNGRSTAWSQAVTGPWSAVAGNGVGEVGTGSDRAATLISAPPEYDPEVEPEAEIAGSSAFLDSAYAQVQSDVGLPGTVALLVWIAATGRFLLCTARTGGRWGAPAAWAGTTVLAASAVDWVGRSSLSSYTTGFLTLYVLGVLLAAATAEHDRHTELDAGETVR